MAKLRPVGVFRSFACSAVCVCVWCMWFSVVVDRYWFFMIADNLESSLKIQISEDLKSARFVNLNVY